VKWLKRLLFVNKKKQKNFDSLNAKPLKQATHQRSRSFLVLFFKKEPLSSS